MENIERGESLEGQVPEVTQPVEKPEEINPVPVKAEKPEVEKPEIEKQIEQAQAELNLNVEELGKDTEELEGLDGKEGLTAKAKGVLKAGLKEIKNFISANDNINTLAVGWMAYNIGNSAREGKGVTEIASQVLGEVTFFGIAKAVAYLAYGRRSMENKRIKEEKREEKYGAEKTKGENNEDADTQEKVEGGEGEKIEEKAIEDSPEEIGKQISSLKDSIAPAFDEDRPEVK